MSTLFDDSFGPPATTSPTGSEQPTAAERHRLGTEALLAGLNPQQRAAVVHQGSPLLIVAGAGSGKTRVLTHRIAYLLRERHVHPGAILAITFTNKAAGEMKERVTALVGGRAKAMWVSTFHSACVRILRREATHLGMKSTFSIYDAADSQRLMTLVCRDLDLDPKRYPPRSFSHQVSNLKNELVDHETFAERAETHLEKTLAEAYKLYQRRLHEANAFDFDDLIMTTVHLLQAFPDVAEHYRRRFRHVLVDEYQDTNHAQYMLVRELTAGGDTALDVPPAELCVVGDADQSIYAFRGATIRNILDFENDYADATTILLEQNYRSTQTILSAANAVISRNASRKPKNLWSDAGEGAPIVGYVADNEHDEASFVAGEVDRLTDDEGVLPSHVAVFYRTNAQSRVFEEVFIRVGLPYKVVGGVRFYERREVRDALAYLRVLANPADTVSLRRILNVPKRGIGDRAEACLEALAQREAITFNDALTRCEDAYGLAARSLNAVQAFRTMMDELRTLVEAGTPPATVLEAVLDRTGYAAELSGSSDPQDQTRLENLQELVSVAREFEEANPGGYARRLHGAGRPGRRRRRDPRRRDGRRRHARAGRGDADDAAHRQGPRVPGRVPHRARGRRLPAPALARRPDRAGGGAAAGLRRHHPRPRAALPLAGDRAQRVGRTAGQPGVPVPRGDPRTSSSTGDGSSRRRHQRAGDGRDGGAPRRTVPGQPHRHPPRAGRPGHPRHLRAGLGGRRRGLGGARRRLDRLPHRRRQAPAAALRPGREALARSRRRVRGPTGG